MYKQADQRKSPYAKLAVEDANHYHRLRHLPALLALWPIELEDMSATGTKHIVDQLEIALFSERRRGRARHWCYDLNRHLALVSALKAEKRHLAQCSIKGKSYKERG